MITSGTVLWTGVTLRATVGGKFIILVVSWRRLQMVSEVGLKTDENKPQLGASRCPRSETARDETPKKWGHARWDAQEVRPRETRRTARSVTPWREVTPYAQWGRQCLAKVTPCEKRRRAWRDAVGGVISTRRVADAENIMETSGRYWWTWGRWCSGKFIARELSGHLCYVELVKEERQTKIFVCLYGIIVW